MCKMETTEIKVNDLPASQTAINFAKTFLKAIEVSTARNISLFGSTTDESVDGQRFFIDVFSDISEKCNASTSFDGSVKNLLEKLSRIHDAFNKRTYLSYSAANADDDVTMGDIRKDADKMEDDLAKIRDMSNAYLELLREAAPEEFKDDGDDDDDDDDDSEEDDGFCAEDDDDNSDIVEVARNILKSVDKLTELIPELKDLLD